jgi:hypothetical protein
VSVRAAVETDATDEQFAALFAEMERRCPVTKLFSAAVLCGTTSGRGPRCPRREAGPEDEQGWLVDWPR